MSVLIWFPCQLFIHYYLLLTLWISFPMLSQLYENVMYGIHVCIYVLCMCVHVYIHMSVLRKFVF